MAHPFAPLHPESSQMKCSFFHHYITDPKAKQKDSRKKLHENLEGLFGISYNSHLGRLNLCVNVKKRYNWNYDTR